MKTYAPLQKISIVLLALAAGILTFQNLQYLSSRETRISPQRLETLDRLAIELIRASSNENLNQSQLEMRTQVEILQSILDEINKASKNVDPESEDAILLTRAEIFLQSASDELSEIENLEFDEQKELTRMNVAELIDMAIRALARL